MSGGKHWRQIWQPFELGFITSTLWSVKTCAFICLVWFIVVDHQLNPLWRCLFLFLSVYLNVCVIRIIVESYYVCVCVCAHLWQRKSVCVHLFCRKLMWTVSSFPCGLSAGGAAGPVNMLGHLVICLSDSADGPPELQLQSNHWSCSVIQW